MRTAGMPRLPCTLRRRRSYEIQSEACFARSDVTSLRDSPRSCKALLGSRYTFWLRQQLHATDSAPACTSCCQYPPGFLCCGRSGFRLFVPDFSFKRQQSFHLECHRSAQGTQFSCEHGHYVRHHFRDDTAARGDCPCRRAPRREHICSCYGSNEFRQHYGDGDRRKKPFLKRYLQH